MARNLIIIIHNFSHRHIIISINVKSFIFSSLKADFGLESKLETPDDYFWF